MIYETTVIGIQIVAKDTYELAVVRPPGYVFRAGQYTQVQLPVLRKPDPKGNSRQFSIASAPCEVRTLRFVFRDTGSGYKTTALALTQGDPVVIESATGSFLLPCQSQQQHVFIAGGVGIAPFMSVLQECVLEGLEIPYALVYSNQSPESAAYISFIRNVKSSHRTFEIEELYKKPVPELFAKLVKKHSGAVWWIVGPPAMVATAVYGLKNANINQSDIRTESFIGY